MSGNLLSNIDGTIIFLYLFATLLIGFWNSKNIKTMRDFAVGNRKFPLPLLVATIFATWVGAGSTMGNASEVYKYGVAFIFIALGEALGSLILARFVAPRFANFSNAISIGELIGEVYGRNARILTGISGTLASITSLGGQVLALSYFFETFYGVDSWWATISSAFVVVAYSSVGGIKADAFTDLFQFFILIVAFPLMFNFGINKVGGFVNLINVLPKSHLTMFSSTKDALNHLSLFLILAIPFFGPATAQRLIMIKDNKELVKAFTISALMEFPFFALAASIGLIVLAINPNIEAKSVVPFLINDLLPEGIKGFAIAGLLAVIMSTADSNLNAGSVAFINDVIAPLSKKPLSDKLKLNLTRLITILFGIGAIYSALKFTSIFKAIIGSYSFWVPLIAFPLHAALFGFRTSGNVFIFSALSGFFVTIIWAKFGLEELLNMTDIIPALLANGIVYIIGYNVFGGHRIKTHNIHNNNLKLDERIKL